ncbi:MAG: phosphopentomutase, partial [Bacilli bacterium]
EYVGIETKIPFPVFTETGFPEELVAELSKHSGHNFIGNYASSGTVILDELGEEHVNTKALILYTSNDSVLQIAAHEEVISLEELYRVCEIAREITLKDEWKLARVIARPFVGTVGNWKRTSNRHDYSLTPPHKTVLNSLEEAGFDVIGVGKIPDIYNDYGITKKVKTKSNMDGVDKTIEELKNDFSGLLFTNLVEFDSEYGHRRNAKGYGQAIMDFDNRLPEIVEALKEDDLLIITADHGNDPGFKGTDHTREQVPLLIYSKNFKSFGILEERDTFADIGYSIAENFGVELPSIGKSFMEEINEK